MWKMISIVFVSIVSLVVIVYPLGIYIKMRTNKSKIKKLMGKIHRQVDFKRDLLKQYLEINRDVIDEEKYTEITSGLNDYRPEKIKDINNLKFLNDLYSKYMVSFDDALMSKTCNESNKEITNIREYYNNLVKDYNKFKSKKINSILSKVMLLDDEVIF